MERFVYADQLEINHRGIFAEVAAQDQLRLLARLAQEIPDQANRLSQHSHKTAIHDLLKTCDNVQALDCLVRICKVKCGYASAEVALQYDRPRCFEYLAKYVKAKASLSLFNLCLRAGSWRCLASSLFSELDLNEYFQDRKLAAAVVASQSLQLLDALFEQKGEENVIRSIEATEEQVRAKGRHLISIQLAWRARRGVIFITSRLPLHPRVPRGLERLIVQLI